MYTKEAQDRVCYIINEILYKPLLPDYEIIDAYATEIRYKTRLGLIMELIDILVYNNPFCNIPAIPLNVIYKSFDDLQTLGEYTHSNKSMYISINIINDLNHNPTAIKLFELINTIGHELCHCYQFQQNDNFRKDPKYYRIINDAYRTAAISLSKQKLNQQQVKDMCEVLERISNTPQSQSIIDLIDGCGSQNNLFFAISFGSYLELEIEKQAREVGFNFSTQILNKVTNNVNISKLNCERLDEVLNSTPNSSYESEYLKFYSMFKKVIASLNLTEILNYENKLYNKLKNSDDYPDDEIKVFTKHSKILDGVYKYYVDTLSPKELFNCFDFAISQKHIFLQYIIRSKIYELYHDEKIPQKLIDKYTFKYTNFLEAEANLNDFNSYYNIFAYIGKFASTNKKLSIINKIAKSQIGYDSKSQHLERIYAEAIENNNFEFIKKVISICEAELMNEKPNKLFAPKLSLNVIRKCLDIEYRTKSQILNAYEREKLAEYFNDLQRIIDKILQSEVDPQSTISPNASRKNKRKI